MSEHKEKHSESYESARSAFDGLSIEEKASFLVESAVRMIARGVDEAGKAVADAVEEIAEEMNKCAKTDHTGSDEGTGDAEPKKASKPRAKKTSAKKPPAKKSSSKKSAPKKDDDA